MVLSTAHLTVSLYLYVAPHLAKRPSDVKQNGTQEETPFSGTVFHTLSHDVLRFAQGKVEGP